MAQLQGGDLTRAVVAAYERTLPHQVAQKAQTLAWLRQYRNTVLAHNDRVVQSTRQPVAWAAALQLIDYAKDVATAISFGYLSLDLGSSHQDYRLTLDSQVVAHQLERLLAAAQLITPDAAR